MTEREQEKKILKVLNRVHRFRQRMEFIKKIDNKVVAVYAESYAATQLQKDLNLILGNVV